MEKSTRKKTLIHTLIILSIILLAAISLQTSFAIDRPVDNSTAGGGIREGLNIANPNGDKLLLDEGNYTGTNNTGLAINKNVTIQAKGPQEKVVIDAQGLGRIFTIGNNTNVTFINLIFINGHIIGNGGAIYNNYAESSMTFINCTFINNENDLVYGNGGAIYTRGDLTVSGSNFTNNTGNCGGAIWSDGINMFVVNSTFINNTGTYVTRIGTTIHVNYTCNSIISLKNNNISSSSQSGLIYDIFIESTGNNTINLTDNIMNGKGIGMILNNCNNTIIFTNNTINTHNGYYPSRDAISLDAQYGKNNIIFINNDIIGSENGILLGLRGSNNDIKLIGNNITANSTYSNGVYLEAYGNNTNNISFVNNNVKGRNFGFYLDMYNNSISNITINNNNIYVNYSSIYVLSSLIYLNAQNNSNNNLNITNNNITGNSTYICLFNATNSSNNNIIINNNIFNNIGTATNAESFRVYLIGGNISNNVTYNNNKMLSTLAAGRLSLSLGSGSVNVINVTNNNVSGMSIGGSRTNNIINITKNNFKTGTGVAGTTIAIGLSGNSINNVNINNNILQGGNGNSDLTISLRVENSNNTINVTNNDVSGAACVYLHAYNSTNHLLNFAQNNFNASSSGTSYVMEVVLRNAQLNGLYVINNTVWSRTYFVYFDAYYGANLTNILISGNNVNTVTGFYFGAQNTTVSGISNFTNVTINYNRILANTGLYIYAPDGYNGNIDANLNWWGNNYPVINGMTLDNWFAMELSTDTYKTIENSSSLMPTSVVRLSYQLKLYNNNTNTTSLAGYGNLPDFNVSVYWRVNGNINDFISDNAQNGPYYRDILALTNNISISVMGDRGDYLLSRLFYETNSTIVVPGGRVGQQATISGVAVDANGNALVGVSLTVVIGGSTQTVTTNSSGGWSLNYTPTVSGNLNVVVSWAGNATHTGFTNSTIFSVVNASTNSTIIVPSGKAFQSSIIRGVATDVNGRPIANVQLTVTVNGRNYTVTTDSVGAWSLNYTPTISGRLNVVVSWTGNASHIGFTNSTIFSVATGDNPSNGSVKPNIKLIKRANSRVVRHKNIVYMKWLTFKNIGASGSQIVSGKVIYKNFKYKLWKVYNKNIKYRYGNNKLKFKVSLKSGNTFKLKLKVYRPIKRKATS
ncbi:MAG: carboxypeptidase-like regulatory domain-containing protein [Methanobrevibacter sp.]|uniref:beta strand repeat-containing protein n=1 Tax=Methanobrevibacter sp. TaxID=66852 RepID=UPI002B202BA3|nr:carboxypeptidase-like regulatory domain-containing protein [Methanobrevibacter sp.]MEA4957061.1 carboxypeptidase-like regulatory domain-containing protein [Methanobrevibacter sp.]